MTGRKRRWGRALLWGVPAVWLASLLPVLVLRFVDPPTSAFMLARQWQARDEQGFRLRHEWRDLSAISPQLAIAVVAAEDQRFPSHHGLDMDAISDAVADGGARGASTLTQQVAKNLWLWQGRSWLRKGIEAYYALAIELFWPKRRILEVYLNLAEFGDGIYGAEAASRAFFDVPASRLDPHQAARLAAMLPNPRRLQVDRPSQYLLRRQAWVERQVAQLGGPAWLAECCGIGTAAR